MQRETEKTNTIVKGKNSKRKPHRRGYTRIAFIGSGTFTTIFDHKFS